MLVFVEPLIELVEAVAVLQAAHHLLDRAANHVLAAERSSALSEALSLGLLSLDLGLLGGALVGAFADPVLDLAAEMDHRLAHGPSDLGDDPPREIAGRLGIALGGLVERLLAQGAGERHGDLDQLLQYGGCHASSLSAQRRRLPSLMGSVPKT